GLDRDPEPYCRLAPRPPQQLRPLAALREASRMERPGPRVPARLLASRCFCCFSRKITAAGWRSAAESLIFRTSRQTNNSEISRCYSLLISELCSCLTKRVK